MAQDFGDDVGDILIRAFSRGFNKVLYDLMSEYAKTWYREKNEKDGMSKKDADAQAEVMASRPHVCVPFGNATDASYFAQVVRENGTYAAAMTDDKGNGYVQFAKDDFEQVKQCIPQFSEVMTTLKNEEIANILDNGNPVTEEMFKGLTRIDELPDLPKAINEEPDTHDVTLFPVQVQMNGKNEMLTFSEQDTMGLDIDEQVFFSGYSADALKKMVGRDIDEDFTVLSVGVPYQVKAREVEKDSPAVETPERVNDGRASDLYNHTEGIRDKVLAAREQCRDFDDFKELLAKEDVGVMESKSGELMFYEARRDENGEILPRSENEKGLLDWAVGAKTLANKWQCEATHDWFEKNTPKEPTVPAHEVSREVSPSQKDQNLSRNEPQVSDGSLDMNGATPDINQGIESHDGMDTMVSTLRVEREQNGTEISPSMVREQSDRSRESYNLKSKADENRAASKQLSQTNDSPDRDISDKFQQER